MDVKACPRCGDDKEELIHITVDGMDMVVCPFCVGAMESFYPGGVEYMDGDE